jgi:hypothetical protein
MTKILNEGNKINNFILCVCENFCDIILLPYGSGSNFLTSYSYSFGSGSAGQKVTVPTVPVPDPQHCLEAGAVEDEDGQAHVRLLVLLVQAELLVVVPDRVFTPFLYFLFCSHHQHKYWYHDRYRTGIWSCRAKIPF